MGVIKRRKLMKPIEAANEMESVTLWLITHTNKERVQEPRPKADTTLGTDGTPIFVHCTHNNTAHKLIATTFNTLKGSLPLR
jgi:hypothetical protein